MNPSPNADDLRLPEHIGEPDPRTLSFVTVNKLTGVASHISLKDQHTSVAQFNLNPATPEAIRTHFETAKNLYLYAWFVYRFYPIAEQQALASLEFALRERLTEFVARHKTKHRGGQPGLTALLKHAIQQKAIRNEAFTCRERWALGLAQDEYRNAKLYEMMNAGLKEMLIDDSAVQATETHLNHDWLGNFLIYLPSMRNGYAHGSSTLYHTVLHTFEVVTEIINQLYNETIKTTSRAI